MQNRTAGIIATVIAVLLCGCPGLLFLFGGAVMAFAGLVPGSEIDVLGSSEPAAALTAGVGGLCLGLIFILITVLVAYFTLRRKPGDPASAVVDVKFEPPAPAGPESVETKKISEDEPLPPPS